MKRDGLWRRPLAWLEQRSPKVHHFLVRRDKPYPLVREVLFIATFLGILATILWGATGQTFLVESPVVVVESGSMMHCEERVGAAQYGRECTRPDGVAYGRFGTIDPGDLIFVKDVDGPADVETWVDAVGDCAAPGQGIDTYLDCGCDGVETYGACGDVIIFRKSTQPEATPVIHRALFWLEVHGDGTYSVDLPEQWDGCQDLDHVRMSDLNNACLSRFGAGDLHALGDLRPEQSGYITRGDNNQGIDQGGIEAVPVVPGNILGKARGEVPWLGLVKLFASDVTSGTTNYRDASPDPKVMMFITLALIIGTPFVVEKVGQWRRRDDEE